MLLLVNRDKPDAPAAAREVRELIEQRGHVVAELPADNEPLPDSLQHVDLVVVLGGDGTLLAQTRRCLDLGAPMLGINLGKVGFMAEFDLTAVRLQADSLFGDGPLAIRNLGLLHVQAYGSDDNLKLQGVALNDCVIVAGPPFRVVRLALTIDGTQGPILSGDGLVISTPTGSTAYNLSAGGPIVAPTVEAMSITPIAPHSFSFRPIVVGSSSIVEVAVLRANSTRQGMGTTLLLDGQNFLPLHTRDRILVTTHGKSVRFVRNPATDYWARLINKLAWARAPRGRSS